MYRYSVFFQSPSVSSLFCHHTSELRCYISQLLKTQALNAKYYDTLQVHITKMLLKITIQYCQRNTRLHYVDIVTSPVRLRRVIVRCDRSYPIMLSKYQLMEHG